MEGKFRNYKLEKFKDGSKDVYWKGSPNGRFALGQLDGSLYFIKHLCNAPTYPHESSSSEKVKKQMRETCAKYEAYHMPLVKALKSMVAEGGNLVVPTEFFRDGNNYYKVSPFVKAIEGNIDTVSRLGMHEKYLIILTLVDAVAILHKKKIIHGDLKPENILIMDTGLAYVAKVIDFDDCYFESNPLTPSAVVGTDNYYSPELAMFKNVFEEEDNPDEATLAKFCKTLTCKSDVFALGLIMHEYLTGKMPKFPKTFAYQTPDKIQVDRNLPEEMVSLLEWMLEGDIEERASISEVLEGLKFVKEKNLASGTKRTSFNSTNCAKLADDDSNKSGAKPKKTNKTKVNNTSRAKDIETLRKILRDNDILSICLNDRGMYKTEKKSGIKVNLPKQYLIDMGLEKVIYLLNTNEIFRIS